MKESNPVSLRYGISNTRSALVGLDYPIFTAKLRIELFFNKLFLLILEGAFYYSIVHPILIPLSGKLIVYFHFYISQFTIRHIKVKKRRLKKRQLEKGILSTYKTNRRQKNTSKQFKFYRPNQNLVQVLSAVQPFHVVNPKKPTQVTKQTYYKKTKIKTNKLLFHRRLLQFKRIFENLIFKELHYVGRCYFKNVFVLFSTIDTKQLTYQVYTIYQRFPYYKRTTNFIDSINIVFYTLYFKLPNLLISFMCRELERTRAHNRFLRMVRQIMSEFYERISIFNALKFIIKGPVNRHGRTKTIKYVFGAVPCQTFMKDINYFNFFSNTKFGTVGLRLWVY